MKPPGKTTFDRMQLTAMLEAERIEITQDFWVRDGRLKEPESHLVARRDDFAGIVRMIDAINSDPNLLDRLKRRMKDLDRATEATPAAATSPDEEVVSTDDSEVSD